ncbi:MAG: hypothetical protein HY960_13245 [Ignavibacteriae bacterium]|nr:hypothetical protein [Ignavibacteriota bacterium]
MTEIIQELEKIESQIHDLKTKLKHQSKPVELEGIWKGIDVTEEDIADAKKSLFKPLYEFDKEQ